MQPTSPSPLPFFCLPEMTKQRTPSFAGFNTRHSVKSNRQVQLTEGIQNECKAISLPFFGRHCFELAQSFHIAVSRNPAALDAALYGGEVKLMIGRRNHFNRVSGEPCQCGEIPSMNSNKPQNRVAGSLRNSD